MMWLVGLGGILFLTWAVWWLANLLEREMGWLRIPDHPDDDSGIPRKPGDGE